MKRPNHLKSGDKIAIVSPSWGGPETFPHRYEAGKKQLEDAFGVQVVEMPHALHSAEWISKNPQARAEDLMKAFADPEIKGIIASIGGDDSVRILPYLDLNVIRDNPKVFLGYSDTTTLHFACYRAGLISFYGPSIMAGFGENTGLHDYTRQSVEQNIFSNKPIGLIKPSPEWTCEHLDWSNPENQSIKRAMKPSKGWKTLNGKGKVTGPMLGGCPEVMEMIKGSSVWPSLDLWRGAILFLETSEEAPPDFYFQRWLRNYGTQGILQVLNGVILGRPGGNLPDEELEKYDAVLLSVVRDELGLKEMPILSQLDFGHTDPMFVIPYGIKAEIDCENTSLSFLESGTV